MQTHSGEWPSGCGRSNFTCTTDGHLNKHILIHSREKLFKVYHYQSQHSTQISPVIWRETSGSKLEKQILATKSHSSNDLFSSVVLLLQVIFFSILFNVCDISELVSFNYLPQPCFFVFDNPTLAFNIIHCGMNRKILLLHFLWLPLTHFHSSNFVYTNPVPLCLLVGQAGVDSLEAPSLLILNS